MTLAKTEQAVQVMASARFEEPISTTKLGKSITKRTEMERETDNSVKLFYPVGGVQI